MIEENKLYSKNDSVDGKFDKQYSKCFTYIREMLCGLISDNDRPQYGKNKNYYLCTSFLSETNRHLLSTYINYRLCAML